MISGSTQQVPLELNSHLVANRNFIKNERQTFVAVIGAIVLGILTLLTGVCVLLLPLGITSTLSISFGVLGIAVGAVVIAFSLRIIYTQAALLRKNFLEVKQAFKLSCSSVSLEKNEEPILSFLLPSPLDAFTYSKTHCMEKTSTWVALLEIILGISAIVGSVLSELLVFSWLRPGISLGLAITGAALLSSGIANVRAFSLNCQGILHLYFARRMQEIKNREEKSHEQAIESLTSRVNLLESHLNQANIKVADLTTQLVVKQAEIAHLKNSFLKPSEVLPSPSPIQQLGSKPPWGLVKSTAAYIGSFFIKTGDTATSAPLAMLQSTNAPLPLGSASKDSLSEGSSDEEWHDAD
ncbi:CPSIT_0556 family inclusion membrane protein [Chlamydia gallinacea]|uniref:CPSIT_0556 family inclusion membrane protein n=1 Tax=Chlamydia gallinacea TaxID=1457153 RepID=UPI0023F1130B|nr:hypothetical protein [Chlamydia gallinacea]